MNLVRKRGVQSWQIPRLEGIESRILSGPIYSEDGPQVSYDLATIPNVDMLLKMVG